MHFTTALINPKTIDFTCKLQCDIIKNYKIDTHQCKKQYCITKVNTFGLYKQKQLIKHFDNLKEELNIYTNHL